MRRLVLLAAALALTGIVVHAPEAWACSCAQTKTMDQFKAADVVFVGKVSAVATPSPSPDVVAQIAVTGVYKGTVPSSAAVYTARDAASCGVGFVTGTRYAVFARIDKGDYRVGLCDGTTSDMSLLPRAGYHPGSPSSVVAAPASTPVQTDGRTGALIGSGLIIVLVAGAVWMVRRARAGRTAPPAG